MNKQCGNCNLSFEITDEDLKFYDKVSPSYEGKKYLIPPPSFCPDCRQQRRISWRNERSLYKRKCSHSGADIMAMYDVDAKFPVYDNDIWWSDKWDALKYGREIDFSRPFFEQLMELHDEVPHFALAVSKPTIQNSDFVNHAGYLKNCYLIYNTDYAERCMYSKGVNRCFDCLDCFKVYDSEACYECLNSYNCKFCSYILDSYNSSNCHFSYNLIGCKDCFLCVNQQNQQYCFENEKLSKEEYEKKVKEAWANNTQEELLQKLLELKSKSAVKFMNENNTENCTGDYLVNCKNCENCFDCEYLENSKFCYDLKKGDGVSYENYDISAFGVGVIQCYEGGTVGYNANHCLFGENVWESNDIHYSMQCVNNCKDCFGCVGLKKEQYCILNKKYSKEEYEELVGKLIRHMHETGEWGEFFPTKFSPFSYNETMAQEYFSMTKEEVEAKGWQWKEGALSNKNFKILELEIKFYEKFNIPSPKLSPNERHTNRLKLRNPRKLHNINCDVCERDFKSTYSENSTEEVLCKECYQKKVY